MKYTRLYTAVQILAIAAALAAASAQAAQEYYKWKDKDGVTHYSATPPKTESTETVRTTNLNPGETDADDPDTEAPEESAADTPDAEEKVAAGKPRTPAKNADQCEKARKNLQTLETTPRIRMPDGDGFRYLTQEEIEEQKSLNQQAIDLNC